MEWPIVSQKNLKDCVLLSEVYGTTDGYWNFYGTDSANAIQELLSTYKVPVYHVTIHEYKDMGRMPGYKGRVPYIDSRSVYIWTFSAFKTPVVHMYYQGGDRDFDLSCNYEKIVDASTLADKNFEYAEITQRLLEISS